jgi:hypothetical protein
MLDLKVGLWVSVVLTAALLAACGEHSAALGFGFAAKTPAAGAPAMPSTTAKSATGMVSAVAAGKGGAGLNLKFDLKSRPGVGEPADIDFDLTPSREFDRLQVVFRSNDGLEIRSGATSPPVEKPTLNAPLHFTVTVVPRAEGIYSVSAVVLADSTDGQMSRTYAIPVIVGAGIGAPAADSPSESPGVQGAAAGDGNGPGAEAPHPAS